MNNIKKTEQYISRHILGIIALDKKIFYLCIGLGGAVIWLSVFKEEITTKPLLLTFFAIISFTCLLTVIAIILNLSAYRKERETGESSARRDRGICVVRVLYGIGIITSLILAIVLYALHV